VLVLLYKFTFSTEVNEVLGGDCPLPPLPGYTSVPSDGYSWLHVYDRQTEQAMITSVAIASSADNEEQTNMHEIQLHYKKLKKQTMLL